MAENINNINTNTIRQVQLNATGIKPVQSGTQAASFQEILKSKVTPEIKFSAHALERLQNRNIVLTPQNMNRIAAAVQKAELKGSRESLVLMDNLALIVSVKNHTVITAIDGERMKENVFTNIDSAVIT